MVVQFFCGILSKFLDKLVIDFLSMKSLYVKNKRGNGEVF